MRKSSILKVSLTIFFLLVLVCVSLLYISHRGQASGITPTPAPTAALTSTTPNTCGKWTIVNSPYSGNLYNTLKSVAAVSTTDAWAVGNYSNSNSPQQTLIEHWNGSAWKVVSSPNGGSQLQGVAAISTGDVWAVGTANGGGTLIEHWNGSKWSIVSSPDPNTNEAQLINVTALTSNDVWAVGYYTSSTFTQQTLIEHWNGSAWTIISSPDPAGSRSNQLQGVEAISTNNIWTVGFTLNASGAKTLIEHWNGSVWSIASSPNTRSYGNFLEKVTTISADNIWAVGFSFDHSGSPSRTLIEHWNGSTWNIVNSPDHAGSVGNELMGVAAISANSIWAVGEWDSGHQSFQVLIEHWNGTKWSIASSPNPGPIPNMLSAVTRVPASNSVWAVGNHFISSNIAVPLIELHC